MMAQVSKINTQVLKIITQVLEMMIRDISFGKW